MVVGNGLMAKAFSSYKDDSSVLIFASGVSNSTTNDSKQFEREVLLLKDQLTNNPEYKFVYFSTCSVDDPVISNGPYVQHKIKQEELIKSQTDNYLILRLSNVVGPSKNEHTIFNFLLNSIRNGKTIDIWKFAERNLIDKDDVLTIVTKLLESNTVGKTINIAGSQSVLVVEILKLMEQFLNEKASYKLIAKGNSLSIDVRDIEPYLQEIESRYGKGLDYISNLLTKYYSS